MKPNHFILIALLLGFANAGNGQLLNEPESVIFDSARNCYYVSNWGDGRIIQIDSDGVQTVFNDQLGRVAGLTIRDDVLYVASSLDPYVGLVGINLGTAEISVFIPAEDAELLNDPVFTDTGRLFVSDFWGSKLYEFDLETETGWVYTSNNLEMPNGIEFDAVGNRLLLSCQNAAGQPIKALSLEDSAITTVVNTNLGGVDGLAFDTRNRLYISAWGTNSIYRYEANFSSRVLISNGHDSPADISITPDGNRLLVPNFGRNEIDYIELENSVAQPTSPAREFSLHPAYPNPCNSSAMIQFQLMKPGEVELTIYNIAGQAVQNLLKGRFEPGSYAAPFQGAELASGVYIYRLAVNGLLSQGSLVLLK